MDGDNEEAARRLRRGCPNLIFSLLFTWWPPQQRQKLAHFVPDSHKGRFIKAAGGCFTDNQKVKWWTKGGSTNKDDGKYRKWRRETNKDNAVRGFWRRRILGGSEGLKGCKCLRVSMYYIWATGGQNCESCHHGEMLRSFLGLVMEKRWRSKWRGDEVVTPRFAGQDALAVWQWHASPISDAMPPLLPNRSFSIWKLLLVQTSPFSDISRGS